jgi:hypothetical protein
LLRASTGLGLRRPLALGRIVVCGLSPPVAARAALLRAGCARGLPRAAERGLATESGVGDPCCADAGPFPARRLVCGEGPTGGPADEHGERASEGWAGGDARTRTSTV